jgi:sugar phosphate isomerase/epimerase
MKIGASTIYALLSKSALQASEELLRNGIGAVEVAWEHRHNQASAEEISRMRKIGIDYSMHLPFSGMSFAHPNPEVRKPHIKMVEDALKAAEKLGARQCVLHGGLVPVFYSDLDSPVKREYFYGIFAEGLGKILRGADDAGIKIVFENLSRNDEIFGRYEDVAYMMNSIPSAGFCLDIPHAFMSGGPGQLDRFISNMKISHVHVTDSMKGEDNHLAIGKGQLPIKETLAKLKDKGYNGKVIFEGLTLKDTLESVKKLREMVK